MGGENHNPDARGAAPSTTTNDPSNDSSGGGTRPVSKNGVPWSPGAIVAFVVLVIGVVAIGVTQFNIGGTGGAGPVRADADPDVELHTYTVRGIVEQLPDPENPLSAFYVLHEEIPHFRGQGGAMGMDQMTMEFPLAQGVTLDGLEAGDKVELDFVVRYNTVQDRLLGYETTRIEELPADADVNLRGR